MQQRFSAILLAGLLLGAMPALAQDWPTWGRDPSRNMAGPATGLPATFTPPKILDDGSVDLSIAKGVRWVARLGSASYGNPVVAGGAVYVGTNNDPGYDPRYKGDYGVLLCLDEATGKLRWQLIVPKLAAGQNSDFENVGLCSPASVDGDRVYVVTNRCEVVCLDARGLANGNDGPFTDEAQYVAGPGRPRAELGSTDADILWRYDMRDELGVFPHQQTSSSVLVMGDRLYVTTSNGRDWTQAHIPAPNAPSLICLDKRTGKLLGREQSGISRRIFLCTWSSPAGFTLDGKPRILFAADDGFCYGFDANPIAGNGGEGLLKELWRFDCNPAEYRQKDGKPLKYKTPKGPSGVIATPVAIGNRAFIAIGQNPENGDGAGCLNCIDLAGSGDITRTGALWRYTQINRSLSTVSVADGLVYAADFAGFIHCLDAQTGHAYWTHDTEGRIWGSTLLADGKLYVGNETGALTVLAAGKEKKLLGQTTLDGPIYSSALVANGVLFVSTEKYLYAVAPAAKK